VEIYADARDGGAPERHRAIRNSGPGGVPGGYVFSVSVAAVREASDYTARALPDFDGVSNPLEASQIVWQR
jgi:starch phosphorylase